MAPPSKERQEVVVAQFAGPHGLRGEFKLRSFTEDPSSVFDYGPLTSPSGTRLDPQKVRALKLRLFLCRDVRIKTPEDCAPLKGALFSVPRACLPETQDEDDFYIADLVGLRVIDPDGNELGQVRAVQNFGAGDVVEIALKGGQLLLIPFTKQAVPDVRMEEGIII
ncbi:MAG: ribosome maturation factor RimM, partial [Pseudomonadota bacterium]